MCITLQQTAAFKGAHSVFCLFCLFFLSVLCSFCPFLSKPFLQHNCILFVSVLMHPSPLADCLQHTQLESQLVKTNFFFLTYIHQEVIISLINKIKLLKCLFWREAPQVRLNLILEYLESNFKWFSYMIF